jgi:hypothetical protein
MLLLGRNRFITTLTDSLVKVVIYDCLSSKFSTKIERYVKRREARRYRKNRVETSMN